MKLKMAIVLLVCAFLTGCCSTGCTRCGGCEMGYWSTTCYTPNSGGASEAAFTDIASPCGGQSCANNAYTSGCYYGNSCTSTW